MIVLQYLTVSGTILGDQSAKALGTLFGCAFAIWVIYIIIKALQLQAKENKEKREKKGKTNDSKTRAFIKKYVPLVLIGIAIILLLMMAN